MAVGFKKHGKFIPIGTIKTGKFDPSKTTGKPIRTVKVPQSLKPTLRRLKKLEGKKRKTKDDKFEIIGSKLVLSRSPTRTNLDKIKVNFNKGTVQVFR